MLNKNKIKICIIILIFIFITNYEFFYVILQPITFNQNNYDIEYIIKIIEKYLNQNNIPILNEEEKAVAKYWNNKSFCPFSKLISHNLSKEEALLIIEFFKIETIEDLEKLKDFLNNIK